MTTKNLPTWDLTDLYNGITDPKIDRDFETLTAAAIAFEKEWRKKVNMKISAETLRSVLNAYSGIVSGIQKVESYAYLEHSTHTGDEAYGAAYQNIVTKTSTIRSRIIFFELSLVAIPAKKLEAFVIDIALAPYKHFLEKKIQEKKHRLAELAEDILQQKSLTGKQAFIRLQDENLTAQKIAMKIAGKTKQYSVSELLNLLYSPKREIRKTAAQKIGAIGKSTLAHSTFTYNTLMQDFSIDAVFRSFEKPEDMRHLENEVSREAVNTMSDVVAQAYSLVQEYYAFKTEVLHIGPLYSYDKYAPISTKNKTHSFGEAQELVLEAFTDFSPKYANIAKLFFNKRWIDVASTPQKRSGAYCMYVTPDTHPYILLNYHGNKRDVSTLAHELGHGIHAYLARKQNILQFDWPITISETASIFAEKILFEHTIKKTKDPKEKLALIMGKIEELIASIFRQISMYRFEQEAHMLRASQGELTSTQFNALWQKHQKEMFGSSLRMPTVEETYWSLIPHLFHTPFYVYSYAFGALLTLSLYSLYAKSPKKFVTQYIAFLSAGGSKSPEKLASVFNIDLNAKSFWEQGMAEFASLIAQAKTLRI
ncbi:MAG: M3 family oligoendopeptidase [bacterium]|nr:M3 family oligoendopeptidase [bacterium]